MKNANYDKLEIKTFFEDFVFSKEDLNTKYEKKSDVTKWDFNGISILAGKGVVLEIFNQTKKSLSRIIFS